MKLQLLSLAAGLMLMASCGTTRTTTVSSSSANAAYGTAPGTVTTIFYDQYPGASNITWQAFDPTTAAVDWELVGWPTLTASDYAVTFDHEGNRSTAWYDANGNWIGTTYEIANMGNVPGRIGNTLRTQYSNYTVESVQRDTWKGNSAYEVKLRNGDRKVKLLIDENGNIMKSKEKID
ncbi:PepSY-like domain-containing protein [Flaviaesturariibacter amylovorans]|uniref:Putative beta-lactamase-inhibitor-like PepSY-like domain-containing protein n=1 Tax=Flaviaesturariibacter amylovorans TaxID=1084520 RepID=A0ABP8HME1_9BACT